MLLLVLDYYVFFCLKMLSIKHILLIFTLLTK